MRVPFLLLAGSIFLVAPALAQDRAPPAGRYQIAPDEDGFVRLDTETGALTHCGRREGTWRCDVIAEERAELDRRVTALSDQVASLSGRLAALEQRLAAQAVEPQPAPRPSAEEREKELDEALTFAERLMRRFFEMVRQFKQDDAQQRI